MQKIILLIIFIVLICFLIPIFCANRFEIQETISSNTLENSVQNVEEVEQNNEEYNYKQYNIIKLLHISTGEIEDINLDEYLYGVVAAEMPATFEMEALKAQAIVARTYTIFKIKNNVGKHDNADICDESTCCQAWISKENRLAKWETNKEEYWQKIVDSVNSTKGKIITYENEPINAFFHSNSGGSTEIPLNVWGGSGYPYLQVVQTAGEDAYSQYNSEVELTKEDIIKKVKEKYSDFEIDFEEENCIEPLEYTEGGRIKTIKFGNKNLSGVEVRTMFGLKSANFAVSVNENIVKFTVKGYGHGVGMSQTGADALAKQGKNCEEIIKHYYVGVEISNI